MQNSHPSTRDTIRTHERAHRVGWVRDPGLRDSRLCRDNRSPAHRHYRVADNRAARYHRDSPISAVRGADVPRLHVLPDDVSGLQHVPDTDVHPICIQDPQDPGGFQRGQIHWLHHVFHVHRLARLRADLFRHQQRLQGL